MQNEMFKGKKEKVLVMEIYIAYFWQYYTQCKHVQLWIHYKQSYPWYKKTYTPLHSTN